SFFPVPTRLAWPRLCERVAASYRLFHRQYDQRGNGCRGLYAADDRLSAAVIPQLASIRGGEHWVWHTAHTPLWRNGDGYQYRHGYLRTQFHARAPGTYRAQDASISLGCAQASSRGCH